MNVEGWTRADVHAYTKGPGGKECWKGLGRLTAENQGGWQLAVQEVQEDSGRHVRHPFGCQDDGRQHVKEAVLHKALKDSVLLNHNNVPALKQLIIWFPVLEDTL